MSKIVFEHKGNKAKLPAFPEKYFNQNNNYNFTHTLCDNCYEINKKKLLSI